MRAVPTGWITNADNVSYPPAPWHLGGALIVSVWSVPIAALPAALSSNVRPVSFFGRAIIGTAWGVYEPGGVLAYNELLAAVRVRIGRIGHISVTHAWVDDPSSRAGARALWGIPKELATFEVRDGGRGAAFAADALHDGQSIASVRFRPWFALPGWWRLRTQTAQLMAGRVKVTKGQALARVELGSADWQFASTGPLAFLSRRKPVLSARLAPTSVSFGI